jgi:peptide/nickel transport system permease protein
MKRMQPAMPSSQGGTAEADERARERYYFASQWQLIWWKFRQHKLAMIAAPILIALYTAAAFCEFVAPYTPDHDFPEYLYAPPQRVHLFARDENGRLRIGPFVYGITGGVDRKTFRRVYEEDRDVVHPIRFFVKGDEYKLWGRIPSRLHLFGTPDGGQILLFGTGRLGRDLFSRIVYGARISLTIGLAGVFISFALGLAIGGASGYFGGTVDNIVQRSIDLLLSIPGIPLWMSLSAVIPRSWTTVQTYLAMTVILSFTAWTGLARVVRGKLLALREEDFALAARIAGANEWRIISKHLLPLFFSYIIVNLTLSIPSMILGETALSFLGLGLQPPAVSWGVLLQDAQQVVAIAHTPWMLLPAVFVIVTVLMFNFVGDGLRDAADPYSVR